MEYNEAVEPFSKFGKAVRLTVVGSAFVGVGTLLNSYVPAFHAPVSWVDKALQHSAQNLSNLPLARHMFHNNPLTGSKSMTEFLAINIVESALVGIVLLGGGVAMKAAGVKTHDVERWLTTKHGDRPRSC